MKSVPLQTPATARAALLATGLFTGLAGAQTIEIDPVDPIPGTHSQVFASEWNTDGDSESWTTTAVTLEAGAPLSGILTGTTTSNDPNIGRSGISIPSSSDTIIEFKVKKQAADTSRLDLFWGDDNGGISGARVVAITNPPFPADDTFHVVRITFAGQIVGDLTQFRFDITSDAVGNGKTVSLDYFRVYSIPGTTLSWDPGMTGTATAGGTGIWNTTSNFWWTGSAQTNWPATSSANDAATFAGTAGTVTVAAGGITASSVKFTTTGYTLSGGPLTLDGLGLLSSPAGTTTIDAPLAGFDPILLGGNTFIITEPGTQTTSTRLNNVNTGASVDDAFGTGAVILGNGGNVFLSSLGAARTHTNDFEWRGNRLVIHNSDFGTALGTFDLVMDGNLFLAGVAPSDIFLRRNLTVNGIVSGSGPAGRSLYFAGDANTMTLNNAANDFSGTIRFDTSTTLAVVADGSLGSASNGLSFNGGAGGVKLLAAFDSARPIAVSGASAARIDTNGFNSEWSGGVTGANAVNTRLFKQGLGKLTLKGTNTLGGGTQVQGGTLELPAGALLTHGNTWDNFHGVSGGATFLLNGGGMTINSSFYGVGNGTNPTSEALFQIDSGSYTHNGGALLLGFNGNGRFVLNGGNAVINQLNYGDGTAARTAIAELNGGTLTMDQAGRRAGDAVATIRFNGTTVIAKNNKADFLPIGSAGVTDFLVSTGGAKIDTAGKTIGIVAQLQHDSAVVGADGGLTKLGLGSLALSNTNSYTGPTTVAAGSLLLNGFSFMDTGSLTVQNGGRLGGNGSTAAAVTVQSGGGLAVDISDWTGTAGTGYSDLSTGALDLTGATVTVDLTSTTAYANFTEANASFTFLTAPSITGFNAGSVTVNPVGFAGTGTFSVSQSGNSLVLNYSLASGAYTTWINGFPALDTAAKKLATANPDGDGATNFEEFAFSGDPASGASDGLRHSQVSGGKLVLTIAVRSGAGALFAASGSPLTASFDGVNYTVGGTKTLGGFTDTVNKLATVVPGPLPVAPTGYEYVTFELNDAVSGSPKGFLRPTAAP